MVATKTGKLKSSQSENVLVRFKNSWRSSMTRSSTNEGPMYAALVPMGCDASATPGESSEMTE